MNSALKPVLASAGVPTPAGQSSPAKGNVASANHASVGHPQGAQNSLNHANNGNNVPAQNLSQHAPAPAPQAPPHAVPSMAPVSANMAQMAQNMSNHGNLSQVNQSSPAPAPAPAASPSKAPSTSSPLSLVAEKANTSQPLALTRSPDKPEKKEPDSTAQSNGTVDSPKSALNAPITLKAQNTDANKEKQDIAKTSPSTTKPPEKAALPATPQKPETSNPSTQADLPTQTKAATASEPSEKSPAKPAPAEPKPAPTADVAPTQSDTKPAPESASNSEPSPPAKEKEKPLIPAKQDPPIESAKPEPAKVEEKKDPAPEKLSIEEKPKQPEVKEKPEPPKVAIETKPKVAEKEKVETKKEAKPKSTLKLATVTPPLRKRRQASPAKGADGSTPAKKVAEGDSTPSTPADARTKRNRTKVQLYQSPTPELAMATKLSASAGRSTPTKQNDDKLIVFYKNEYLAVRNAEGGFYVCQTMQNVYRTTRKIKIRWLSQDKAADPSGETYKPDFYDVTDMECVLTTLSLTRASGTAGAWILRAAEQARATSILQRALKAETSGGSVQLTPEHPDGLDLSLYTDESQIEKRRKRAAAKGSPRTKEDSETAKEEVTPVKKARTTPKRSPKSTRQAKPTPPPAKTNNNKRKSTGSTPIVASTSKTATAVIEKAKAAAKAPSKRTPAKQAKPEPVVTTPLRKGGRRAAAKEAVPSTSTGKTGRTPRKLPQRK